MNQCEVVGSIYKDRFSFNARIWIVLNYWMKHSCIFNVHGSVHRKYIPIYIQQDVTLHSLFISGNCSTCFGWYHHSSSGAHTTVSTVSGICHTLTATCCYRGGGSSNGVTNTRYCRYSCMRSWWWVEITPEICRAVSRYK